MYPEKGKNKKKNTDKLNSCLPDSTDEFKKLFAEQKVREAKKHNKKNFTQRRN